MSTENPYGAPQHLERREPPNVRVLWMSVGVVFVTAVFGGILGAVIGSLLGTYAPDYFRAMFFGGSAPDFDPVGFGISVGLGQGAGAGAAVGVVLVALFYWYRTRIAGINARL